MQYRVPYLIENRRNVPEWGAFTFTDEVQRRIDRFIEESVTSHHGRNEILKEAELCFPEKKDDEFHYGMWRGEFWGKLMLSAVRICRMKQDPEYRAFLKEAVYALLTYQREDGYLSTYRDSRNVFRADTSITIHECGWACYYNWNIWCRKYTLWGLIEAAQMLDDAHILACADRLAGQMIDDLEALGVRVKDTGVMSGMPACSILKPVLLLYRLTGNARYLEFGKKIGEEWDRDDGECPNLVRNAMDAVSPLRWYTEDHGSEWYSKAYEMMSCFDGICELYRVTGDQRYLQAAVAYYDGLIHYESNILGSVSYCERFQEAALYPDAATEICDVIHWMRLCHELYCITGHARYMESLERAFLNAFLAGMYEDGKNCAFFIRSHGRHWDAIPQCSTKYQHCCFNNLPRGFVNAAQSAVMQGTDGLYVNLWLPAEVAFGETRVSIGEGYTSSGNVTVTVQNAAEGERLFLRIPPWSRRTEVNGKSVASDGYCEYFLQKGTNEIRVCFDMTPRIIDFTHPVEALPEEDYHVKRWLGGTDTRVNVDRSIMLRQPMSTVQRGPIILARSKKIGSSEEAMFSQETVCGKGYTARCEEEPAPDGWLCRCKVTFTNAADTFTYTMCDLASAANQSTADGKFFTLFV